MACWAIGDIQGCGDELTQLAQHIRFNPDCDQLWLCGDLVNRGPHSLATLQWLYARRDNLVIVLGNHDLHLMAVAAGCREPRRSDTFHDVLQSPRRDSLLSWLYQQKLAVFDASRQLFMSHAGLPPHWPVTAAVQLSAEVMQQLQRDPHAFFSHMYGNEPTQWHDDLQGLDRLRYTVNALTRMRFVDAHGALDLKHKGLHTDAPTTLTPWFRYPNRHDANHRLIFGHWAALHGNTGVAHCIALDTGCVWGGQLTAYNVDTGDYCRVAGWQAGATLAGEE